MRWTWKYSIAVIVLGPIGGAHGVGAHPSRRRPRAPAAPARLTQLRRTLRQRPGHASATLRGLNLDNSDESTRDMGHMTRTNPLVREGASLGSSGPRRGESGDPSFKVGCPGADPSGSGCSPAIGSRRQWRECDTCDESRDAAHSAHVTIGARRRTNGAGAADPGAESRLRRPASTPARHHGVGAGHGLHSVLTAKAEAWAQHMADTGCLCHSNLPDGVTVGWRKLGENIGRGPDLASIHQALVHSPPHYANMVDPAFHWIGVGIAYGGGQMYVAEVFMDGDPPPAPVYAGPGADGTRSAARVGSAPTSASWAPDRLDVFATANVRHAHPPWVDGQSWSAGWENLAGQPGGLWARRPPSPWAPNRLDVFVTANDGTLQHNWWNGAWWSGWENLGGQLASAPAVASWALGPARRLRPAPGGALVHKYWNSGWSGWELFGGGVVGDPTAVSWASGRVDVFVRGTDNRL